MNATKLTLKDWEALGYREVAPGQLARVQPAPTPAAIAKPARRKRRDTGVLDRKFREAFTKAGGRLEDLVPEFVFAAPRKWRADFFHPASKTLIELEGGLHLIGRHNSPEGYARDCQKYNAASALGYRLFRLPSNLITEQYLRSVVEWLAAPTRPQP